MAVTRTNVALLILAGLGVTACATEAQRKQEQDAKAALWVAECDHKLGLAPGQSISEDERVDLKWCVATLWAREKLQGGSKEVGIKFVGLYIPNCEAILGKDWGEIGSEKRSQLVACLKMESEKDLDLERKMDRTLFLEGMQSSFNKGIPINCYTYGNWTQCR